MIKKMLSILMAIVMCMCFNATAFAAEATTEVSPSNVEVASTTLGKVVFSATNSNAVLSTSGSKNDVALSGTARHIGYIVQVSPSNTVSNPQVNVSFSAPTGTLKYTLSAGTGYQEIDFGDSYVINSTNVSYTCLNGCKISSISIVFF